MKNVESLEVEVERIQRSPIGTGALPHAIPPGNGKTEPANIIITAPVAVAQRPVPPPFLLLPVMILRVNAGQGER